MRKTNIFENMENDIMNADINENEKSKLLKNVMRLKDNKINIMITGATGCGKSSTINALFDTEVAKVGVGVDPETMEIEKYELDNLILYQRFLVMGPTGKPIDIELSITPDNEELRGNITAAFRGLLDDKSEPEGEVLVSSLHAAILSVSGLDDYTLYKPTANIQCGLGELAILGEVTWR